MNINAGTNSYNIKLTKLKEEKRPTFATIFDKLDARSKKLNNKNPLNAVMTNEQMYRYYLEEVEPLIQGSDSDNLDTLDEILGNKNIKDMKLSEFAKLLMGNVNDDKGVKYETLAASVSSSGVMSIAPIAPPAPPTPTPTPPPTIATPVIPAPSSSVASALAPPVPVSGLMPASSAGTGSIPAPAPAPAPAPVASVAPAPVAPAPVAVAAPVAPVVASVVPAPVVPAAALTISTAPTGIATPPFSPTSVFASLSSAVSSGVSAVSALVKPSPSAISVPPSAVVSGATTAVASGVPTGTPASGVLSPTSGAAAAGAVGVLPIDTGGYTDRDRISAFSRAIAEGLTPPRMPVSKTKTISKDEDMIKYAIELSKYNDGLKDKKFTIKPTTAIGKMITIYERLNKRGATEDVIIKEIKKG